MLTPDLATLLKTEAATILLSFLTKDHVDAKNDNRHLHDDTFALSAVFLLSILSTQAQKILNKVGYSSYQSVQIIIVLYQ